MQTSLSPPIESCQRDRQRLVQRVREAARNRVRGLSVDICEDVLLLGGMCRTYAAKKDVQDAVLAQLGSVGLLRVRNLIQVI